MCFLENRLTNGMNEVKKVVPAKRYDRDLCCLHTLIQKGDATEADKKEYNERLIALKTETQNKNRRV